MVGGVMLLIWLAARPCARSLRWKRARLHLPELQEPVGRRRRVRGLLRFRRPPVPPLRLRLSSFSCWRTSTRPRRPASSSATAMPACSHSGRGVFELTGFQEGDLMGRNVVEALSLSDLRAGRRRPTSGAYASSASRSSSSTRSGGDSQPVTVDLFPAYDADGGLLVPLDTAHSRRNPGVRLKPDTRRARRVRLQPDAWVSRGSGGGDPRCALLPRVLRRLLRRSRLDPQLPRHGQRQAVRTVERRRGMALAPVLVERPGGDDAPLSLLGQPVDARRDPCEPRLAAALASQGERRRGSRSRPTRPRG